MVIQYTLGHVELPYPVKFIHSIQFPYPINIQEFLHNLILGLPFTVKFPYPVKYSMRNSAYFFKRKNNQ